MFVALGLTRGEYGRGSVETGVRIWRKGYLGSAQLLLETKTRGWGVLRTGAWLEAGNIVL